MQRFLDAMDTAIYTAPPPDPMPGRVLAALGPRMLALAATRTDGAHPYLVPPEHTAFARDTLGDGQALLAPEQTVVLETDPDVARGIARDFVAATCASPTTRTTCCGSGTPRRSSTQATIVWSTRSSRGATSTRSGPGSEPTTMPAPTTCACRCSPRSAATSPEPRGTATPALLSA